MVLYLNFDHWLFAKIVKRLEAARAISWIKYAFVRDDPAICDCLREVLDVFLFGASGQWNQRAASVVHRKDFGVIGFTSGCVVSHPSDQLTS